MEEEFEDYQGEVIPFEDYEGEVIPFEESQPEPTPRNVIPSLNSPNAGILEQVVNIPSTVAGGIINAGKELVQTGIATSPLGVISRGVEKFFPDSAAAKVAKPISEGYEKVAGLAEEYIPEYQYQGGIEETVGGLTQVGVGLAGGNKLAAAQAIAKKLPNFYKNLARFGGAEAGIASTVSEDSDTLITGENSIFGDWNPISIALDEDGDYNEEMLKKRMNILFDAFLIAKPLEYTSRVIGSGLSFATNLTLGNFLKMGSKWSQEDEVARTILDKLVEITPNMTPRELAVKRAELIEIIDQNKNVVVDMAERGIENPQLVLDTMSALERGVNPENLELIARLRRIRKSAESSGAPKLEAALDRPVQAIDTTTSEAERLAGGSETIEQARQAIVQSGREDVSAFRNKTAEAQAQLNKTAKEASSFVKDDPVFGPKLADQDANTDLDFGREARHTKLEIGEEVTGELDKLDDIKVEKLNEIPEGVEITTRKDFAKLLTEASKLGLDKNLLKDFRAAKGDFKKLYSLVPRLNKKINNAFNDRNSNLADAGIAIRDYLNNEMENIPEAADFVKFFKEEYAPFAKEGKTGEIHKLKTQTIDRKMGVDDFREGRQKILTEALDQDDFSVDKISNLLRRGNNERLVADYYIADSMRGLNEKLASSDSIEDINLGTWVSSLSGKIDKLKRVAPEQATRLNSFVTKLKDRNLNIKELKKQVETLSKEADKAERQIIGKELAPFFDKTLNGKEVANGYEIFKGYIADSKNTQRLDNLIERINSSGSKDAKQGLQSAFIKYFRENVLSQVREQGTGVPELEKTVDFAFDRGRKIFSDKPEFIEALKTLNDIAQKISKSRGSGKQAAFIDFTQMAKGARGGVDFLVTQAFGALNRIGARVRSGAGKIVGAADPQENLRTITDAFLADPDKFLAIANRVTMKDSRGLDPQVRRDLYKWLTQSGVYDGNELPPEGIDE